MRTMIPERPPPGLAPGRHWCVVLAAGGSRRLGRPKQLVRPAGNPSLVRLACERALATQPAGVVVVIGARGSRVRAALRGLPVTVVRNGKWRDGLAGSLRVGVERVPSSVPSVLVTTVDQWRVSAADLRRLLHARAPAAAEYGGIVGVPALLPRCWRRDIRRMQGDRGARALLEQRRARPVRMPTAAQDLDVPADLVALRRWRGAHRI
jgi:CTP:molybdopterin cytidylyltransferase MocA